MIGVQSGLSARAMRHLTATYFHGLFAMESARSVTPNGAAISYHRKQRGLTVNELADLSKVGKRTVERAIAGKPVDMGTLQRIATALDEPYTSLVIAPEPEESFKLNLEISLNADDPERIKEVIGLLQKLLPANVVLLAAGGGTMTVGISEAMAGSLKDVERNLAQAGAKLRYAYPKYIYRLGDDRPFYYLSRGCWRWDHCQPPPRPKPWGELTLVEQLRVTIEELDFDVQHPGTDHPIPLDIPLAVQYDEIQQEMESLLINGTLLDATPEARARYEELQSLAWHIRCLDARDQVTCILHQVSASSFA